MNRTAAIAAALLLAAPLAPAVAAEDTRFGLDAEVTQDTNATRGPGGADSQSDNILSVEGSATRSLPLSSRHTLDFSLTYYSSKTDLGGYKYDGAQLRATYLYRFQ